MKSLIVLAGVFVACAVGQHAQEPEQYGPPAPYLYSYATEDSEGSSTAEESTNGSRRIQGKYTILLADADETGFHADVITNVLGTESKDPADATILSSAPTGVEAALQSEPRQVEAKPSYAAPVYAPAPATYAPVHARYF
ncbi:cuticle protein 10.9-like [Tropilaelaps mercedesae]|uniref:Cuticle protein 10.9-like n=1 Tax=Tropilaelaps mercedesae TaxID=418985 RepID=A0A1V9Y3H2_9ACAR|nr:cuticle protein 10.9-like [Tropilaelaps mercedesae]